MIHTGLLFLMQFLAVMLVILGIIHPFLALILGLPERVSESDIIKQSAITIGIGVLGMCLTVLLGGPV